MAAVHALLTGLRVEIGIRKKGLRTCSLVMAVRSAHHTLCHFQYCSPTCVYEPTRRISRASRHHSQCTHFHPSRHGIVEGFPSYSNTASAPTGGVAIFTPAKFISPSRQPVVSLSLGLTLGLEGPLRQVVIKIGSTTWLVSKKTGMHLASPMCPQVGKDINRFD